MKNLHINKKIISIITSFAIITTPFITHSDVVISYEYKDGTIYIVDEIKDKEKIKENDICILDQRDNIDPNIKIFDSYKIKSNENIEEIVNKIIDYEKEYPSNWNRTKESLISEWYIHNQLYFLNIKPSSTKDVDFNNNDEDRFLSISSIANVFKKYFKKK